MRINPRFFKGLLFIAGALLAFAALFGVLLLFVALSPPWLFYTIVLGVIGSILVSLAVDFFKEFGFPFERK